MKKLLYPDRYGKNPTAVDTGDRFSYILRQAHKQYGHRCVVLVDEYDKPILDVLDTGFRIKIVEDERLLEDRHREILKGFYSVFKAVDEDLQFVLLTGRYYRPEEFIDYKANVEKPLPMIYQSGYLTIKDFNQRRVPSCWTFPTMR